MKTFNYESNCVKYRDCFFDVGEYEKGKMSLAIYGYVENDNNISHISNATVNVEEKLKENEPISNNKFKKIDIYRKFERNNTIYIIIGWKSVYWPASNKSINILESVLKEFKDMKIPFQYMLMNENILTDIKFINFHEVDENVNIFSVERKIKTTVK